uniref:Uncharacterized protein n=1 Tax=Manihot esculenta TaxID=3983 RepID=A0A2C9U058_MANES
MSTDQRPFARFRLPWLSAAITRPVAEPQPVRPPVEIIQAPTQPTTTVPAQRPPFQPAGITPTQSPPPQPQAPQITEPQPSLPPRAIIESRLPASPSRPTTQPQAAAVPPSPSQVTLQSVSPSRVAPQPRVASVPPSPTRTSSQPQPTVQTVWQQFPWPLNLQANVQAQAEEPLSATFHSEQKQLENEDKKISSIISSGEHIKIVSSTQPKAKKKFSESHHKPSMLTGEQVSYHKEIRDDNFKFVHKLGVGQLKYPMDERPVSIVTIAGENRGASMVVRSESAKKYGPLQ